MTKEYELKVWSNFRIKQALQLYYVRFTSYTYFYVLHNGMRCYGLVCYNLILGTGRYFSFHKTIQTGSSAARLLMYTGKLGAKRAEI
jgi:hypothetical protein